jgi:hypothetical protein
MTLSLTITSTLTLFRDINMRDFEDTTLDTSETIEGWVMERCEQWRDHYKNNYENKFEEYYRLWRGIFSAEDKTRESERSRIVSPALQQAVESSVAEVEEATFGRGKFFDIDDDMADDEPADVAFLREKLHEDFGKTKVRKAVAECLINAAVFGTGIAEVIMEEIKEMSPATQPILDGQLQAVGVNIIDRTVVRMRPVLPNNFLIDPVATSIEEALGVAIDEYVPTHTVEMLQEKGVYKDVTLTYAYETRELNADPELVDQPDDKVRLTKYYGLVPRHLLRKFSEEEEEVTLVEDDDEDTYYVEAVIVVANGGVLLKAEENPYMMQDRPVIAFPWDIVPGRFWGRGVCEKGYNSQKALDAELRARIDALALTVHPMMAMDASRMPRGFKPEIRPGKIILTNGNPAEIFQPFNFGQVNQITFAQAEALQRMVQTATGAIDSAGVAGSINGDATAAGISMSLGAIIKRHKRTLINFQESFLIPFVTKAAHRYMQFDPEHYPVADYKFVVTSSLGIIAREYEVTQLVQLLQTMSPESPLYPALIQAIIDNMNLSNREELIALLKQAAEPSPEEQEAAQMQQKKAIELQDAQIAVFQGQANEFNARSAKYDAETRAIPVDLENDRIKAISSMDTDDERNFAQRVKIAELAIKEQYIGGQNGRSTGTSAGRGAGQRGVPEAVAGNTGDQGPAPRMPPRASAAGLPSPVSN